MCKAGRKTYDVCYLAERLGRNDGISPCCLLSKPCSLWQSSHRGQMRDECSHGSVHAREVRCSPGPGSREALGGENRFTTTPSVCSLAAAIPGRKQALLLWTTREAVLSLQVCCCPLCTSHFSMEGWDLSPWETTA